MPALLTLPCLPAAEVDDLVGGSGLLEEGQEYRLPVLPLDGLVLCPGNTLPLRLSFRSDRALVQQALEAPPPLTRLIAVVCCTRSYFTPQLMLQRCAGRGAARVALRQRCLPRAAKAVALDRCTDCLHCPPSPLGHTTRRVGCVAEIRKMGGGGTNLLAKGRQRVEVELEAVIEGSLPLTSVPVR